MAWSRWRAWLLADTPALSAGERSRAALGALLGIGLCGLLFHALPGGARWLIAPVGASAVILFALSHSPLAQPWSVVGAYIFAALAGLFCVHALPLAPMAAGVAVGATIWLMARFNCIHPPAGALALLWVLDGPRELGATLSFLGVIAVNVVGMLGAAILINNLLLGRRYPYRIPPAPNVHRTDDKPPTGRISLTHADLERAVRELDTFIDVQEDELIRLYNLAVAHAFGRHVGLTCGDIMSRDVVTVRPDTDIERAWRELRAHKIRALPVVDEAARLVGVLTVADYLRQMDETSAAGLAVRLQGLIRRESGADRAETVGQIMTTPVRTAHAGTPAAELVHLLSDQGMHHVPVVDDEQRVIGMVTQSDLIAALYARIALALA